MASSTSVSFPALKESVYLARPAKSTSPVALQAQLVDTVSNSVKPVFDVEPNSGSISKFINKVRNLNEAVSSIIPESPTQHLSHPHRRHSMKKSIDSSHSMDSVYGKPISEAKIQRPHSFSVYDRDCEEKDPIAVISRNQISFSLKATPLLHDRKKSAPSATGDGVNDSLTHPELAGQVTWAMSPKFSNSNPTKLVSFKVTDEFTGKIIGRWRRRSSLEEVVEASPSSKSKDTEPVQSLGDTASNRYYLADTKSSISRPFFSGEANLIAQTSSAKAEEEWCFVVTKRYTKTDKVTFKKRIVAVLKGYELHLVDENDKTLKNVYLDEYIQHLRQKGMKKKVNSPVVSQNAKDEDNDDDDDNDDNEEDDNDDDESDSTDGQSKFGSISQASPGIKPTTSNFTLSSSITNSSISSSSTTTSLGNFCRVRVNDALIFVSMCLLLNLDDIILAGLKSSNNLELSTCLSNGSASVDNNYTIAAASNTSSASPKDSHYLSPSTSPTYRRQSVDSNDEKNKAIAILSEGTRKVKQKLMKPLKIFGKD